MRIHRLEREQFVRRPLDEVFAFFSAARNLESLTPPFLRFQVLTPEPIEMRAGTVIDYRLKVHGVPLRWVSRIERWEDRRSFVDRQLHGPYRLWHHRHDFESHDGGTLVSDRVDYAIPMWPAGELAHALVVRRDLAQIFDFRQKAVRERLG
jgi:ligand-binding SRPBCC domain-containing protein